MRTLAQSARATEIFQDIFGGVFVFPIGFTAAFEGFWDGMSRSCHKSVRIVPMAATS
jgi:hypothetical protein